MTLPKNEYHTEDQVLNLSEYCIKRWSDDDAEKDRIAFIFVNVDGSEEKWTYAELWDLVVTIGKSLVNMGYQPGDRILVRLEHEPNHAFAFFGAVAAGLAPIPLSPQLTDTEVSQIASDCGAAAMIVNEASNHDPDTVQEMRLISVAALLKNPPNVPLPQTRSNDPAFFVYTSGTTSTPKGVVHAQRTVLGREFIRHGWLDFKPTDTTLHAGTINWTYTLGVGLMDAWRWGATAILCGGEPNPEKWLPLIEQYRVTIFAAVPTVYRQILKYSDPSQHNLSALRHVLCAGEPLSPALRDEWTSQVGAPMYESLGMTEISTYISNGPAVPIVQGSPGKPQAGRTVAILDADSDSAEPLPPGELGLLAVHRTDPGLMLGYWQRPEEETHVYRGDWFTGGDLAIMDKDGYIWFKGRADDIIKSFGFRLSPAEIEHTISKHHAVNEVAVIGLPIDSQKNLVVACIIPEINADIDFEELKSYCSDNLATYKQPHDFVQVSELPRTRNGKLQRSLLVDQLLKEKGL